MALGARCVRELFLRVRARLLAGTVAAAEGRLRGQREVRVDFSQGAGGWVHFEAEPLQSRYTEHGGVTGAAEHDANEASLPFALNRRIADGPFHGAPIDGPEPLLPDRLMPESFKDFRRDPGERGPRIDDEFELLRPQAIRRGDSDFRHDDSHGLSMHRIHDIAGPYKYVTRRVRELSLSSLAEGRCRYGRIEV